MNNRDILKWCINYSKIMPPHQRIFRWLIRKIPIRRKSSSVWKTQFIYEQNINSVEIAFKIDITPICWASKATKTTWNLSFWQKNITLLMYLPGWQVVMHRYNYLRAPIILITISKEFRQIWFPLNSQKTEYLRIDVYFKLY